MIQTQKAKKNHQGNLSPGRLTLEKSWGGESEGKKIGFRSFRMLLDNGHTGALVDIRAARPFEFHLWLVTKTDRYILKLYILGELQMVWDHSPAT